MDFRQQVPPPFDLVRRLQQFQVGNGHPHLQPLLGGDFCPAPFYRHQHRREILNDLALLARPEPGGHPSPENPPFGSHLGMAGMVRPLGVEFPQSLSPMGIKTVSKAGPKAKPHEVEPSGFKGGAGLPDRFELEEFIGQCPQGSQGPTIPWHIHDPGQGFGHPFQVRPVAGVGKKLPDRLAGRPHDTGVQDGGFLNLPVRLCPPELELKLPPVGADPRTAPQGQGSHLRKRPFHPDRHLPLLPCFSKPNHRSHGRQGRQGLVHRNDLTRAVA